MRLAHLADLHLGFRRFERETSRGINQREADVGLAFRYAVDGVIAAKVDAVLIAGDVFHQVRPNNFAITYAFQQLKRIRDALPASPVILVAGNHDYPKEAGTGCILSLFTELGCEVVLESKQLEYPGLSILAVSEVGSKGPNRPPLTPQGSASRQVLLIHTDVPAITQPWERDPKYGSVTPEDLDGGFDYVALGDFHCQHQVGPKAWYAGSLDYTSSDPWRDLRWEQEQGVRKGWLLVDLEAGTVERQPIPLVRPHVDFPTIDAEGMTADQLNDRLAANAEGIEGTVARQIVVNCHRETQRLLDWTGIRRAKALALNYQLEFPRKPTPKPESAPLITRDADGRWPTWLPDVDEFSATPEELMVPTEGVGRDDVDEEGRIVTADDVANLTRQRTERAA